MARDSSATKARLLDAAFFEFATYGIAGARVDRIADAAQANKRLIYVYYGNKEQLFDAVLQRALETGSESVPFDVDDLPGYAGAVFDHLVERPSLMRLVLWKQLERPTPTDTEATSYQGKIAAVRQAQEAGRIDAGLDATDVLTLVMGLSQAWFSAVGGPAAGETGSADWPPEQLVRHRTAVVESVRRITAPQANGETRTG
ncbi:TetR family transcriptional regulator [Streptomyces agglomeratus]|uniref:TetR family transcriptional regulator n=1 Tax=Streptomyces agglomeratus TaxID=285458 RepID=A0A1E5PG97_9ACTN|nr:TetR family transcriptional regulator [Streptomyces agglomeratus]OEJ28578.1 TetR family transcriptional regulator [Streptomyces agglomeratus]OEJ49901.1 TetR family transcriptional regulator [Streptomyces agglomeratus]